MDHFGIGAAVKGATEIYFQSARRTGRTSMLVESAKSGDTIVFADQLEANRVNRLCVERNKSVQCIVVPTNQPWRAKEIMRGRSTGRLIFDHSWVEMFYRESICDCVEVVDAMQRDLSAVDSRYEDTALDVFERYKWHDG
jgi:hypothetical protein